MKTEIETFAEIEEEFIKRVHSVVWCSAATIDTQDRPRSRVLHPIWEGATGWIGTRRNSLKAKHLAHRPYISLAWVADIYKPVYADCRTEWIDDLSERERIWEKFKSAPPPLGYDPELFFGSLAEFGLLKLTPWRIEILTIPNDVKVWRNKE